MILLAPNVYYKCGYNIIIIIHSAGPCWLLLGVRVAVRTEYPVYGRALVEYVCCCFSSGNLLLC